MKKRFIVAGLLLAVSVVLPATSTQATSLPAYNTVTMTALTASPEYKAALATQANNVATAANNTAIATQQQADQATLLAIAATQTAAVKQAEANQAVINAAAANQVACNMIILNNPVLLAAATKPAAPVDPRARNLELLHNINTIDQARLAAVNARATANMTLTRLNDVNALLKATKAEVTKNPGLTQRLNELTAYSNALTSQYDQQNKDATAKETTLKNLQATLPTAGYNPEYWRCYY